MRPIPVHVLGLAAALCLLVLVAACSMRVSGVVSDRDSGQPIGACSVSIGDKSTYTDPTGRYTIQARRRAQEAIKFIASGYAVQTKSINAETTRYPVVDVELFRTRAVGAPPGARFDPYTGEPLRYEVPRFDPYTGKPLDPKAQ